MEQECYTVAIPNMPIFANKKVREFIKWIPTLEGFVGVHPHYPDGTLILFKTENNAKAARNLIQAKGVTVGKNICKVYVPKGE